MDSKKEQIIQTALKRFSHYGFDKTTMSEIAVDMNITKANLYYYYPDKNSLVKDVMTYISQESLKQQDAIVNEYDGDLLETLYKILEFRAERLRHYYVLHIHKNMEWIKGQGVASILEEFYHRDIDMMKELFGRAVYCGEINFDSIEDAATSYVEIMEGLTLIRSVADMFLGMPNAGNVEEILKSQKKAIKFIFNNKTIHEN
ncbi:MAG TPA: TetR/AcrR family transcriptional regulator [Sphingobacterium sp.]|jgi:TetR/AcrR family transcriptional regulator|nr:TetR/AcrR family transcriptional regulator [Sphingobacterium sp.]